MKNRGFGTVYQPTYKDKKTGEYKRARCGGFSIAGKGK
jgi:hypothetical protein